MSREEIDKDKILALYLEEEKAIIDTYNTLTEMEMSYPEKFFKTRHTLRHHLSVISAIVKNLLALEIKLPR